MKTDNELIAEFMGLVSVKVNFTNGPVYRFTDNEIYEPHEMEFSTSWDWLMPVVKKIDEIYKKNFPPDFVHRILTKQPTLVDKYMDVIALPMGTPIEEVYKAVVEFIKWYNDQKSLP